ncbi:uncharacterized protein LOC126612802 [Malus sylvestris]|uniref:uncharacterized protein LOC126612802 n=1 Tax=Malus sylvestris TaxID=3752 RepID=UPI0021ABC559|nr:uncharacterized protein LOC126612802 [Malus sylvestris]
MPTFLSKKRFGWKLKNKSVKVVKDKSDSPKSFQPNGPNFQSVLQELADSFAQLPNDLGLDLNDASFDLSNGRVIDEVFCFRNSPKFQFFLCGQALGETFLNLSRAWEQADTSTSHALASKLPVLEDSLRSLIQELIFVVIAFGNLLVSAGRRFQSMGQYGQGKLQKIGKVMITTGKLLSESSTSAVTDETKKESRILKFGDLQLELTSDKATIGAIISFAFGIPSWELAQGIQNIPESSLQYANDSALILVAVVFCLNLVLHTNI